MPAESLPVVILVIAMFASFMIVVSGVWIWSSIPEWRAARKPRTRDALRSLQIKTVRS